jgi:hypothetical protein
MRFIYTLLKRKADYVVAGGGKAKGERGPASLNDAAASKGKSWTF